MKTKLKTFRKASSKRARRDHVMVPAQETPASTKARRLLRKRHGATEGSYDAFDPSIPVDGSLIVADELRDQFNGLFSLIQERVTEAELNTEVSSLEAQIDERVTQEELDTAVSGLTAQIDERVTETELSDVVNGLNIAIDQRITQAQLNTGMDVATNNAINTTLPQTSANSNGVSVLSVQAYSYYDQYQFQQVIDKIDELINALRR